MMEAGDRRLGGKDVDNLGGRGEAGRVARIAMILVIAAVVLVGIVLVVTQIDKWRCGPPTGVWVEAADECVELP